MHLFSARASSSSLHAVFLVVKTPTLSSSPSSYSHTPPLFPPSAVLRLAYARVIPEKVASLQASLVTGGTVSEAKTIAGQPHNFVLKGGDAQVKPPPLPPT